MFLHLCYLNTPARRDYLGRVNRCTREGKADSIKGHREGYGPGKQREDRGHVLLIILADYWIIELEAVYEYAVVCEPDWKSFWVLSRAPAMEDKVYAGIVERRQCRGARWTGSS